MPDDNVDLGSVSDEYTAIVAQFINDEITKDVAYSKVVQLNQKANANNIPFIGDLTPFIDEETEDEETEESDSEDSDSEEWDDDLDSDSEDQE